MSACNFMTAAAFDDGHLFIIAVVAVLAYLATCSRRPQRQCPRCKEINRPHSIFCCQCGTRLPGR